MRSNSAMKPVIQWDRGSSYLVIGSQRIPLPGPIGQVMSWDQEKCIAVLLQFPESLLVFGWDGRMRRAFSPPPDFRLYYLTSNARVGVSVVCVSSASINGWSDWQFGMNLETGELERLSPSK